MILIIGVLAAIAIPAFASQKGKAADAQAKELARTAETTAETIATDNNGEYTKVTAAELNKYEPAIRISQNSTQAYLSAATASKTEYSLTAKSTNGDELKIAKSRHRRNHPQLRQPGRENRLCRRRKGELVMRYRSLATVACWAARQACTRPRSFPVARSRPGPLLSWHLWPKSRSTLRSSSGALRWSGFRGCSTARPRRPTALSCSPSSSRSIPGGASRTASAWR